MQILTPTGYVDAQDLHAGDLVSAFIDGNPIINTIESIEKVSIEDYRQRTNNPTAEFKYVTINGTYSFFQDQSVWVGDIVKHVSELEVGDVIYSDTDSDITVTSVSISDSLDYWWRLEVDGDHSYIADGLSLHNASRFWVGGTGTWDNSTTTNWSATTGGAGGSSVPGSSDTVTFDGSSGGGTVTPNYDMTVTSITMGAFTGTLTFATNNNSPTMVTFSATGTAVRTLNLGNGTWSVTGSGTTIWTIATSTNMTMNAGSSIINFNYSGSTGSRTIGFGSTLTYATVNVNAGSDTILSTGNGTIIGNFSFAGFTGTNSTFPTVGITGNFTFGTGMTCTSVANVLTFQATSGTQTLTSNGVQVNRPITINAVGATVTLADDLNMDGASARTLTLTAGTFDSNSKNITVAIFSSSNTNVRTITMGTGNTWTLVGSSATIWALSTTTNLTFNQGTAIVNCTYSGSTGTRVLQSTVAPYTIKVSAGSDNTTFSSTFSANNIDFSGYTGLTTSTSINVSGSFTLGTGMTVQASGAAILTMTGTGTITCNGVALSKPIVINTSGTITLADALDNSGALTTTFTLTQGTFNANGKTVTIGSFSSSNSNTRTLTMGSGQWTLTGNNATIWTTSTVTNMTLNAGALAVICNYSGATGTRTITLGAHAEASAVPFNITAGTDIISTSTTNGAFGAMDFTGFSGSWTRTATALFFGDIKLSATMTITTTAVGITFASTAAIRTLTSNGVTLNCPLLVSGSGGGVQLADTLNCTSSLTVNNGTFESNSKTIAIDTFSSSGSGVRTINFGTGNTWTITGVTWTNSTTTNGTFNWSTAILNFTNTSVTACNFGSLTPYDVRFSGTNPTVATSGTTFRATYLSINGSGLMTIAGNWAVTNFTCNQSTVSFIATTGSRTFATSAQSFYSVDINTTVGVSVTMQDALLCTNALSVTQGTFSDGSFNVTAASFSSSNTNTRVVTVSSTWTMTGTGVVWDTSTTTGLTLTTTNSTITLNNASSSSKTFSGGVNTFNNIWLTGAGTGTFIIGTSTAAMTFNNFKVDTPPHTIQIFAGKNITFTTLTVSGSSGNLNTFQSTSSGTPFTFTCASGIVSANYISLKDSTATGGASFFAGESTNVSGNTGWNFGRIASLGFFERAGRSLP